VLTQNEHFSAWKRGTDQASSFQPVEIRHADVHDDDVGLKLIGLREAIVAVDGFPTNLKVRASREKRANAATHNFMIVHN
jgi:hypothetical protein